MEEKKCTYTTAQIGQYMMNKMSPEEETLLQEHLYLCPECSRKLQEMRRLAETLADRQVKMVDKKKLRQRNFVKILVPSFSFSPGVTASIGGNPTPWKKKSSHPHHPIFFTTRTHSKLRTRLKSREKP